MGLKRWRWLVKNRKKLLYLPAYLTDPKVSLIKKLWVFAPLVYLLLPMDLIPDIFFGPGFIDDAIVILLLFGKIRSDLERYISEHNRSQSHTENGPVIDDIEYKIHDE